MTNEELDRIEPIGAEMNHMICAIKEARELLKETMDPTLLVVMIQGDVSSCLRDDWINVCDELEIESPDEKRGFVVNFLNIVANKVVVAEGNECTEEILRIYKAEMDEYWDRKSAMEKEETDSAWREAVRSGNV